MSTKQKKNVLSRDLILAAQDRKTRDVEVEEWGGTVRLASMSTEALLAFRDLSKRKERGEDVEAESMGVVLADSLVDDNGVNLFDQKDIPALLKKSPKVVLDLFMQALDLNDLRPKKNADGTATPPVEEQRKNS